MSKREYRMVRRFFGSPLVPARLMVIEQGWAMVRRKGAMPFLVPETEWIAGDPCDAEGNIIMTAAPKLIAAAREE